MGRDSSWPGLGHVFMRKRLSRTLLASPLCLQGQPIKADEQERSGHARPVARGPGASKAMETVCACAGLTTSERRGVGREAGRRAVKGANLPKPVPLASRCREGSP